MAEPLGTPHVVCSNCGHTVTVAEPLDACENCHARTPSLCYFAELGDAEEFSDTVGRRCRPGAKACDRPDAEFCGCDLAAGGAGLIGYVTA